MRGTGVDHLQGLRMDATACRAGSSGRHRMAISQALMASARRAASALGRRQHQRAQVVAALEPFMDLQAGGALVAVDEYEGCVMARCFLVMGLRWTGRPGLGCLLRSVIPGSA